MHVDLEVAECIVMENVEYVTRGGDKGLLAVLSAGPSS
jgi:hypothetical protein